MYIVYDDMNEYAEVASSCYNLFQDNKCSRCPLFDVCGTPSDGEITNAAVRGGEIRYRKEQNNG